jgi:ketosteroid isomerase-like protein
VAVDRWQYTLRMQPKAGGTAAEDRGKGVWIWRRDADSTWRLAYALWNSDLPAPTTK